MPLHVTNSERSERSAIKDVNLRPLFGTENSSWELPNALNILFKLTRAWAWAGDGSFAIDSTGICLKSACQKFKAMMQTWKARSTISLLLCLEPHLLGRKMPSFGTGRGKSALEDVLGSNL